MRKLPKPGDRVIVPAAGREVEGEVQYISTIFDPPEVNVAYHLDKELEDEPFRNLYPIDMVRPVSAIRAA